VTTLRVRAARPSEYDAVGELTAAAYLDDGAVSDDYLLMLRDAGRRAEVAELLVAVDADGTLVGTVTLVPPDAPPEWRESSPPGAATIRMLAVPSAHRRRGVGVILTRACIERGRERGWPELSLLTATHMAAAHRLYEQLGFVRRPALDLAVRPGLLLLGYSLPVTTRRTGPGTRRPA
jgi:ribosomal protein S18 acetylase RimI-like enzyme